MKLLLMLVASSILSGCASGLPKPPSIELYMHHQPSGIVFCSRDGKTCPSVRIEQTNKWYMLKPSAWRDLNNYIDELIRRLEAKNFDGSSGVSVTANDLRRLKAHLQKIRGGFHYGGSEIQLLETEPEAYR